MVPRPSLDLWDPLLCRFVIYFRVGATWNGERLQAIKHTSITHTFIETQRFRFAKP
jgi:hypothetical protein